jgi:hypothetical protein
MTEEKKKPEEDEVSDEQLDDVAGGGIDSVGGIGQVQTITPQEVQSPENVQQTRIEVYDESDGLSDQTLKAPTKNPLAP